MIFIVVFFIVIVTASAAPSPCRQVANCTCGKTHKVFSVCMKGSNLQDVCRRWSSCKSCQNWLERCHECPDGFEGPFCKQGSGVELLAQSSTTTGIHQKRHGSRQKRVSRIFLGTPTVFCFNPGTISLGQVVVDTRSSATMDDQEFPEDTRLQYSCNTGYILEGANSLTCTEYGTWSADLPRCQRASPTLLSCYEPDPIPNGNVEAHIPIYVTRSDPDEYPSGTRLEYTCENGYKLSGYPTLHCLPSGVWSNPTPICKIDCGKSVKQIESRLSNDGVTKPGEWPWMVMLKVPTFGYICSGTLINPTTVVTAAHCLIKVDDVILYFGKLYIRNADDDDEEVQVRNSSRIIIHPHFNRNFMTTNFDSDIALILFEPKVSLTNRVSPVCLPSSDTTAENLISARRGYVTGWGITAKELLSNHLQLDHIVVVTNMECMESYKRNMNISIHLTQNQYCAGNGNGQQNLCSAYSGSPMTFYNVQNDKYTMEGLVSFGTSDLCKLPGRYTVFTNVYKFVPWIYCMILQKNCIDYAD